jgi:radical SAM superfamily enzyme YgiQ (UPF0313 family)
VQLIDHIKRRLPDTPIVLGGEHVTSMPELCLLTSKADYVVLGEGEETIVELLEALDTGMPHAEMLGIGYREGDDVVVNPRRERTLAIDDIARPAWHLIDTSAPTARRPTCGRRGGSPATPSWWSTRSSTTTTPSAPGTSRSRT